MGTLEVRAARRAYAEVCYRGAGVPAANRPARRRQAN